MIVFALILGWALGVLSDALWSRHLRRQVTFKLTEAIGENAARGGVFMPDGTQVSDRDKALAFAWDWDEDANRSDMGWGR